MASNSPRVSPRSPASTLVPLTRFKLNFYQQMPDDPRSAEEARCRDARLLHEAVFAVMHYFWEVGDLVPQSRSAGLH
jgi:hypothetical protein